MPRGAWARSDILTQYTYARFLGQFFLAMGLQWEKKIVVPCLDLIMNTFFPRNIQWSSLFARKVPVNTERVPPGHPIILLKSNKFNLAAVLVKRSIFFTILLKTVSTAGKQVPLSSAEVRCGVIRFPLQEVSAGTKTEGPLPTAFLSLHSRHAPLGLYRVALIFQ